MIRQDPTVGITPPKVPKAETKMKIPTPEQVGAALLEAPDHFRAFVAVCAFAGLRLGEAAGLQFGDIDFLRRTLTVERQIQGQVNSRTARSSPKYESARVIYLPDDLVTLLSRHVEHIAPHGEDGYLFSLRGYVYNRNSAGNQWRRVRKQVGMDEFTLHDLTALLCVGTDRCWLRRRHGPARSRALVAVDHAEHLQPSLAQGRGPHSQRGRRPDVGGHRRENRRSCGLCADSRHPLGP